MKEIEGQLWIENIPVINLAREYGLPYLSILQSKLKVTLGSIKMKLAAMI